MRSLQTILSSSGSVLIFDAASTVIHAGWLPRNAPAKWTTVEAEAGVGLFAALGGLAVSPGDADAFVFCEGPGSILGIRTVATILRTWTALRPRPVYAYRSLELVAHTHGQPGQTIICDARRQSWHALSLDNGGTPSAISRISTEDLPTDSLATLVGFRRWSTLPDPPPAIVAYDPPRLSLDLLNTPILRESAEPDAFQHEGPSYAQWTPKVHQAPPPKA